LITSSTIAIATAKRVLKATALLPRIGAVIVTEKIRIKTNRQTANNSTA